MHEVELNKYKAKVIGESSLNLGTEGSFGIEKIHLTLKDGWDNGVVIATFKNGKTAVDVLPDSQNIITVPPEATARDNDEATITFVCLNSDRSARYSADLTYLVTERTVVRAITNPAATGSTAIQAVEQAENYRNDAYNAKESAMESADYAYESAEKALQAKESAMESAFSSLISEEKAQDAAEKAQSFSSHPPIIGESGNWLLWNGNAYVDSRFPAQGSVGERGPQGPAGERGPAGETGPQGPAGRDAQIDGTLSVAGMAADAAAVGNALALKLDINQGVENAGKIMMVDDGGMLVPAYFDIERKVILTVNLNVIGAGVRVYNDLLGDLVADKTYDGSPLAIKVNPGLQCRIEFNEVESYTAPVEQTVIVTEDMEVTANYLFGTVYQFHVDSNESNPSAAVTYGLANRNFTPAKMDFATGEFDWGSWGNAFFIPKPCMLRYDGTVAYYLNPDNYAEKADGTPSDVANLDFAGNAMMEWGKDGKKIWYKIVPDEGDDTSYMVFISNEQTDADYHAYNFYDKNDVMIDHFYTPIYSGSYDGTRLRSMSGLALANSQSGTTEIAIAKANGDGWNIECWADKHLMFLLLYLMGKSLDVQDTFGRGHDSGGSNADSLRPTGEHDAKGLFWGSDNGTDKVKVFGMEDQWAEQWSRINGLILDNNVYKYKLTEGVADGSSKNGYSTTDTEGMINGGVCNAPANQYVTKMAVKNGDTILPIAGGGSSSTYYCDLLYKNASGVRFALIGGYCRNGLNCGLCFSMNNDVGREAWNIGSAVSCKPLVR